MNYVLPFVDCGDPIWLEQYKTAFHFNDCLNQMDKSRFRPFSTLKYAFRSVAVNMPFIDKIVLIVSTESQVPDWVNRDTVRVVTHDEFMPLTHLPTFNSSAIESDMWRIDGLSECFVYGNDDFFAMNPMKESDFFDGDIPRLNFEASDYAVKNIFRMCCRKGMDMAAEAAGVPYSDGRVLLKPQHCMKGIKTASMKEVGQKCADKIEGTISMTRHWSNVTGYLYHYYEFYQGNYRPFKKSYKYIRISNDYQAVIDAIRDRSIDMLCINDAGDLDDDHYQDACEALNETFKERFPNESKFEIFQDHNSNI